MLQTRGVSATLSSLLSWRCYVIVYQSWKRRTWIFKVQCWDFMSFCRKLGKTHAAGAVSHERTSYNGSTRLAMSDAGM